MAKKKVSKPSADWAELLEKARGLIVAAPPDPATVVMASQFQVRLVTLQVLSSLLNSLSLDSDDMLREKVRAACYEVLTSMFPPGS